MYYFFYSDNSFSKNHVRNERVIFLRKSNSLNLLDKEEGAATIHR